MAAGDVSVAITGNNSRKCASFNSNSDEINFGDIWKTEYDEFSIAFWIKRETLGGSNYIFSMNDYIANKRGFALLTAGAPVYSVVTSDDGINNGTVSTTAAPTDQWQHIVMTVKRTTKAMAFYVDNTKNGDYTLTFVFANNLHSDVTIGAISSNLAFEGEIADVQFWDKRLTETEITKVYRGEPVPDHLIHKWNFKNNNYDDSVGSADGTSSGTYITVIDDAVALQLATQRVTANDHFLLCATPQGQFLTVGIEESP